MLAWARKAAPQRRRAAPSFAPERVAGRPRHHSARTLRRLLDVAPATCARSLLDPSSRSRTICS
eukprot:7674351-Lingulodinium_polyedra.AAC.1